jgi:hypothetical protein
LDGPLDVPLKFGGHIGAATIAIRSMSRTPTKYFALDLHIVD